MTKHLGQSQKERMRLFKPSNAKVNGFPFYASGSEERLLGAFTLKMIGMRIFVKLQYSQSNHLEGEGTKKPFL